ncbi:MAG: nucleoside phosphorylase [Chitinophagales bacterium]
MMEIFQHSELILNTDGSVYHLHLLPHQIAHLIITVGDPERVETVSKHFDVIEHSLKKREFITQTGRIGSKNITVISTGIGTDNIDIVLNELHLLANYDFEKQEWKENFTKLTFIRIGTSGSIQPDIPVDSFLLSEYAIGIDNMLNFYNFKNSSQEIEMLEKFKMHAYFPSTIHPYITSASSNLLSLFDDTFLKGITLTAPGFYAPQGRKINTTLKMDKFYDDVRTFHYGKHRITNIEMETAGLYGLARVLGHEAISCNALLANRSNGMFSSQPYVTVGKMTEKIFDQVLNKL